MKQLIKQQGKKIIAITFAGKTNAFDDRRTATVQWHWTDTNSEQKAQRPLMS